MESHSTAPATVMAQLGRLGGQAKTPAKAAAARRNGRLGGLASSEAKTAAARENARKRWANQPPSATALAREERARRNAPCLCNPGRPFRKKFKFCCGRPPKSPPALPPQPAKVQRAISTTPLPSVKAGRNQPCPCGSKLKFKKCCGNTPRRR